MISVLQSQKEGEVLKSDVCIVGSGPASLALALKLAEDGGKKVIVLESQASPHSSSGCSPQFLYQGELTGWLACRQADYLTETRARCYGGTSILWNKGDFTWSMPFAPSDFEAGWPFSYEELMKQAYPEAQDLFWLGAEQCEYGNPQYWIDRLKDKKLAEMPLAATSLRTRILQFCRNQSFAQRYQERIGGSPLIHVLYNANLLELDTKLTPDGQRQVCRALVRGLDAGCRPGGALWIEADEFVIAAGAVETTRILLLNKLGNGSDHLGRSFMEHFRIWRAGSYKPKKIPAGIQRFYFHGEKLGFTSKAGKWTPSGTPAAVFAMLVPTPEFMKQHGIGNFRVLLGSYHDLVGQISIDWEHRPNPDSRITLSDQQDVFGQRKVKIDLRYSETDGKTVKVALAEVREVLSKLGYAGWESFKLPDLEASDPFEDWKEGYEIHADHHPMGSTRMSKDPQQGVVDENCRVHGTKNLYVASASVFPTGGYANPTLTLLALTCRLADHLNGK